MTAKELKRQIAKTATNREAIAAPLLFVVFVCLYAACNDGTVCSNDGSSYALTKSIAERGGLSIGEEQERDVLKEKGLPWIYSDDSPENADNFWLLTENTDLASKDGRLFSDRSPGTAVLAVPFYFAGKLTLKLFPPDTDSLLHTPPRIQRHRYTRYWTDLIALYKLGADKREKDNRGEKYKKTGFKPIDYGQLKWHFHQRGWNGEPLPPEPAISASEKTLQYFAALLPVVLSALTVVFVYLCCRLLGLRQTAGIAAALVYGLCTVCAKYGFVLFTHAATGFFVVLALYMTLRIGYAGKRGAANYILLGFAGGMAFVCEYPYGLFVPGFLIYLFLKDRRHRIPPGNTLSRFALFALGILIPLTALGAYNAHCFGEIFTTSYRCQEGFAYNKNFFDAFGAPISEGLRKLLIDPEKSGLLAASPVIILAILGFYRFFATRRGEAILTAALFMSILLIMSKKVEMTGGSTNDHRYIAASIGLLVLGAGFFIEGLLNPRHARFRYFGMVLFAGLFIYSAYRQFCHYLVFMTFMKPEERLADAGLLFPGYPKLVLIFPAAALVGYIWFAIQKRTLLPGLPKAPDGIRGGRAARGKTNSRHREKEK